tara:strand:- start:1024 stop:1746 length:723 start_codon:yes stop_codon:yes gene_type:complete
MITVYPAVIETPFELLVAQGKVSGVFGLNIYGTQSAVGATFIPVWENATAYTYPASAIQMTLYSSSASDTALSVQIEGLDASYALIAETLVLTNGTTGVTTVNSYLRINVISTLLSSANNPVGIIYLSDAGKTITYAQMDVGSGRSQMSIYTVPAGHTFYLERVSVYTSAGPTKTTYYRSETTSPTGITRQILTTPFITRYTVDRIVPRPYLEKTDIQFQASSDATSYVSIQVEGELIKN